MIQGNKTSGYLTTIDARGRTVERETRQCAHCQATWLYQPGSGARRGLCAHCRGLLCGQPACLRSCAPFSELVMDRRYALSAEGVLVKR